MWTLALTCLLTAAEPTTPPRVAADTAPSGQSVAWSAGVGSFQGVSSFDLTHAYPLNYFLAGFYVRGGVQLSDRLGLEVEGALSSSFFESIVRATGFADLTLTDHLSVALGASIAHAVVAIPSPVAGSTGQVDDVAVVARVDWQVATSATAAGRRRGLVVGLQTEAGSSLPTAEYRGAFGFGVFVTVGARWW